MRLIGRVLVCAGLVCLTTATKVSATPVVLQYPDGGGSCTDVLGRTNTNCGLYSLGSLEELNTLDLTFESDAVIALFAFSVASDSTFFAQTSSSGLNSMFGLFDANGNLHTYDQEGVQSLAFGADIDPFAETPDYNDALGGFVLAADTTYYLAVLLSPIFDPAQDDPFTFVSNGFNGTSDSPFGSLAAAFGCEATDADGNPVCPQGGGTFSLQLSAVGDGGPQAVPEPGTFALLGTGVLAAMIRRRVKKHI